MFSFEKILHEAKRHLGNNLHTRFAPTPSGFLHTGNAFSFLITWLTARFCGGKINLRIDDNDFLRARPEFLKDIFETIAFLGLDYDEGAKNQEDFSLHFSQNLRREYYLKFLQDLSQKNLLFACPHGRKTFEGVNHDYCLREKIVFSPQETALRVDTSNAGQVNFSDIFRGEVSVDLHTEMPFFVLCGKNFLPAYQLVSLAEDVEKGINFIVRGEDLLHSTAAQIFLSQKIAAFVSFGQTLFLHHTLLLDDERKKLSKSAGALSLKYLRENHYPVKKIYHSFCRELSVPPCDSAQEILAFLCR